jgi:hypothetical protein
LQHHLQQDRKRQRQRSRRGRHIRKVKGTAMKKEVIQDWTDSTVLLKFGKHRDVRYQVYRDGQRLLQEIRAEDDTPIHTLELPTGLVMERQSYEVLLRYVLLDVVSN